MGAGFFPVVLSFNPRPRVRGDSILFRIRSGIECFNPRPRVRGDTGLNSTDGIKYCFNPRVRLQPRLDKVSIKGVCI